MGKDKDFNLSEKIERFKGMDLLYKKDVKEFIKKLKEEINQHIITSKIVMKDSEFDLILELKAQEEYRIVLSSIDKLAGDDLI